MLILTYKASIRLCVLSLSLSLVLLQALDVVAAAGGGRKRQIELWTGASAIESGNKPVTLHNGDLAFSGPGYFKSAHFLF